MSLINRNSISGLLLLAISCSTAIGQNPMTGMASFLPIPGFVIFMSGDTVYGKIACSKYKENYMSVITFRGQKGEKIQYDASSLKGVGICQHPMTELSSSDAYQWDLYECRPSPKKGEMVFMPRISDGRIKVFIDRNSAMITTDKASFTSFVDGIGFYYSSDEGLMIGPSYSISSDVIESRTRYSRYYVEKDGSSMILVDKGNYESLWDSLYGDCPAISEEVSHNPDLKKFKYFLILMEVYNQLCPGTMDPHINRP